jgi:diaminopropionate ammonia-lyase
MVSKNPLIPENAMRFWTGRPEYQPTPLRGWQIGSRKILVKDETGRMGLGAFKALGGIYAVARLMEERESAGTGLEDGPVFVCASAGNHGMAVAEGARLLGARARIHLSETVPEGFADKLRARGAEVVRSGAVYEDSIAMAVEDAAETGAIHLADGSWPGYTEPPRLVMEGYTVMAEEMRRGFEESGEWPAEVYLQAGVGGLAGAVAYMIRKNWAVQPEIIVVEPDAAPCLRDSVRGGLMTTVEGPVSTMGRLDCKTPSLIAFEILNACADHFVTVSDAKAEKAAKLAGDQGTPTTPSGAAGLAAALDAADDKGPALVIISEGPV